MKINFMFMNNWLFVKIQTISIYIFLLSATYSCANINDERVSLNGEYIYRNVGGNSRMILSKSVQFHNKIYPTVTDYVFNENYIIAEQKPEAELIASEMAKDLTDKYNIYAKYSKDKEILNNPFYSRYKGKIESDSLGFREFLLRNTKRYAESEIDSISIYESPYGVVKDSYYQKLLSNKINYWILDVNRDTLIGPLTKEEYLSQKNYLKIPNSLSLKFERDK